MQERKLAPYWRPDLGEHWNHQPKRMNLTIAPNSVFNYLWLALNTKLPIVSLGTQQILKWCPIWRYTFCQRCSDQFLPIGKHGCVWPVIKHKFRVPAKVRYINFNTLMKLKFEFQGFALNTFIDGKSTSDIHSNIIIPTVLTIAIFNTIVLTFYQL